MPAILAADPGVNPTICVLYDDPGKLLAADFYEGDETSFVTVIGGKNRRRPNPTALLAAMRESLSTVLVLESVGAMPGEAPSGAFTFGHAHGLLEGLATALGMRVIGVRPQEWKKYCGIPPKAGKAISRHVATNIAPNLANEFKSVASHNKADAFLMAWWARGKL